MCVRIHKRMRANTWCGNMHLIANLPSLYMVCLLFKCVRAGVCVQAEINRQRKRAREVKSEKGRARDGKRDRVREKRDSKSDSRSKALALLLASYR